MSPSSMPYKMRWHGRAEWRGCPPCCGAASRGQSGGSPGLGPAAVPARPHTGAAHLQSVLAVAICSDNAVTILQKMQDVGKPCFSAPRPCPCSARDAARCSRQSRYRFKYGANWARCRRPTTSGAAGTSAAYSAKRSSGSYARIRTHTCHIGISLLFCKAAFKQNLPQTQGSSSPKGTAAPSPASEGPGARRKCFNAEHPRKKAVAP